MDYALPRAEDLPPVEVSFNPVRDLSDELGVKGTVLRNGLINPRSDRDHPIRRRNTDFTPGLR